MSRNTKDLSSNNANYPAEMLDKAHKHCISNREALKKDSKCGCFYCLKIFNPVEIEEWIEDEAGDTAICPYCDIDSILAESSGYPITEEFLTKMYEYWF